VNDCQTVIGHPRGHADICNNRLDVAESSRLQQSVGVAHLDDVVPHGSQQLAKPSS
jgi:hypothetical protein